MSFIGVRKRCLEASSIEELLNLSCLEIHKYGFNIFNSTHPSIEHMAIIKIQKKNSLPAASKN